MLTVKILTPDATLYDGLANRVSVPGLPGRLTILPHHAPVTAALLPGEVVVNTAGNIQSFTMHSGFLHVENNTATIIVSHAQNTDQLDESAILSAKARAEELLASRPARSERLIATTQLRNSLSDLRILRRRKSR